MSIRLFFGSSTPAMRAIAKPFLALALLVARVGAQDAHDTFAPHHFAVLTNFLHRRSDLHNESLSHPVCYSASREVVWREFDGDFVAGKDLYVMHPHLARNMRQHLVPV